MIEAVQSAIGIRWDRHTISPVNLKSDDWKQLSDSVGVLLHFFGEWRSSLFDHMSWGDDAAPSTNASLVSLLQAHYHETVSVTLQPYLRIAICHCRDSPGSKIRPEHIAVIRSIVRAIICSIEVSSTRRFVVLNPVGSFYT
jgi:hypothetical protein